MVAASVMDIGIGEEMVGVAPAVVDRLAEYFADVASGLVRSEQRWAAEYYARALMMDGARKSLEPMVARIGGTSVDYEALQHFLADSPWDPAVIDRAVAERVRAVRCRSVRRRWGAGCGLVRGSGRWRCTRAGSPAWTPPVRSGWPPSAGGDPPSLCARHGGSPGALAPGWRLPLPDPFAAAIRVCRTGPRDSLRMRARGWATRLKATSSSPATDPRPGRRQSWSGSVDCTLGCDIPGGSPGREAQCVSGGDDRATVDSGAAFGLGGNRGRRLAAGRRADPSRARCDAAGGAAWPLAARERARRPDRVVAVRGRSRRQRVRRGRRRGDRRATVRRGARPLRVHGGRDGAPQPDPGRTHLARAVQRRHQAVLRPPRPQSAAGGDQPLPARARAARRADQGRGAEPDKGRRLAVPRGQG